MRLIQISYASAKNCKGDDSTAQGNTSNVRRASSLNAPYPRGGRIIKACTECTQ